MNLTQTAILTKRVVFFSAIFLFFGIGSFTTYKFWQAYTIAHLPPIEEKPDLKFGILQYPDFPKTEVSSSNYSYSVDTQTGTMPKVGTDKGFEKLVKVYFIPKPYSSFLSADRSKALAQKFAIDTEPQIQSENTYLFQNLDRSLNINLDSGNFSYINQSTPSAEVKLSDESRFVDDFQRILSNLVGTKEQLTGGRSKIIYFQGAGENLIQTNSRQDADFVQISIWPKSIDNKQIYTTEYSKSLVNALVYKSAEKIENFNSIDFVIWDIDTSTTATYPAKTVEETYADLQSGKGIVVLQPEKAQVSITDVYPGFYMSKNYYSYLIPIYVFIGPSFAAYVPAVDNQYLNPTN